MAEYEPKILGFLCNWCAYAGADLAGVSRFQYPPNLRIIRVMCSGRVDPEFIIEAFLSGIDGVTVLGCHPGDCHYQTGNLQAERKMKMTQRILEKVGIIKERFYLDWVSAAEGARFAELVAGFIDRIKKLGPLGDREGMKPEELKSNLLTARELVREERIRWLVGKEYEILEEGNVYGEKKESEEYHQILEKNIDDTISRIKILSLIEKEPKTVKEIAKELGYPPRDVFSHITYMRGMGKVELIGKKGNSPLYKSCVEVGG